MKKFLVTVLVIAMVSMMGLVAFAAYPTTKDNWNLKAAVDVEAGTVTFTYDATYPNGDVTFVELAIYDSKPDFTGKDMVDGDIGPYMVKVSRPNGNFDPCISEHVVVKGDKSSESAYPFEEGKTYYATIAVSGTDQGWVWAPDQVISFTYAAGEQPAPTADVSTIAFAVASVLGCGALVVRKKR